MSDVICQCNTYSILHVLLSVLLTCVILIFYDQHKRKNKKPRIMDKSDDSSATATAANPFGQVMSMMGPLLQSMSSPGGLGGARPSSAPVFAKNVKGTKSITTSANRIMDLDSGDGSTSAATAADGSGRSRAVPRYKSKIGKKGESTTAGATKKVLNDSDEGERSDNETLTPIDDISNVDNTIKRGSSADTAASSSSSVLPGGSASSSQTVASGDASVPNDTEDSMSAPAASPSSTSITPSPHKATPGKKSVNKTPSKKEAKKGKEDSGKKATTQKFSVDAVTEDDDTQHNDAQ